jgi:hypothetical protein
MARFFKLTPEMGKLLRENLTLSEWKLWSLFVDYDSFGDKYVEIPPLIEILMECDISQATFYRAIAKFKKLNLFDFQYDKAYIRNLSSSTALSLTHENSTITHENFTITHENSTLTHENSSIYKEYKEFKTLSEALSEFSEQEREKIERFCKKEADLLPEPPRLVTKWILKNLDDLLEKYKEINPSAFNPSNQGEKSSAAVHSTVNIDPAILEKLDPLIKKGLEDGSVMQISSNWMIGVHQIQLFGGRWVDAKNWVNSQMPRAEIPQDMKNNLKALGGLDDSPTP